MNVKKLLLALSAFVAVSASARAQPHAHWARVADLNTAHMYHACVAVDGKIYTVGGGEKAAFEQYDETSNVWRVLPQMPTPRSLLAAAAVGRRIYAIGGLSEGNETVASVECFDLDTRVWQRCSDLPTPRSRLTAVTTGGKILVIGGMDQHGNRAAVEEFDSGSCRLRTRAPMPHPRPGHSAG